MNEATCPKCSAKTEVNHKPGKATELVVCQSCKNEFQAAKCTCCGSANVYGISRVVGYYSKINNWNKSKTAEFRDRQKGDYKLER
jgi:anaerobic ribonucleoside-triphosphate reductase